MTSMDHNRTPSKENQYEEQPFLIMTPTTSRQIMSKDEKRRQMMMSSPVTPDTATSSISHLDLLEREIPPDDSFGIESEDFEKALGEIGTHWYGYMWTVCLGIVGVLDMLATAEPNLRYFGGCLDENADTCSKESYFCSVWLPFMHWLDKRDVGISFVFSLLWFKLAFNKAGWAKERASIKKDRDMLLSKQQESKNNDDDDDGTTKKNRKPMDPRAAYFIEITTNMLFLPVGFYVIIYHFFRGFFLEGKGLSQELEDPVKETIVLSVTEQSYGDEGGGTKYEIFTEHTKISLIVALSHHIRLYFLACTVIARAKLREFLRKSAIPVLVRKILGKAIRNPRKFRRNLSAALRYFRYVKYMAPIIGGLNKLKANVSDMLKKWRQYIVAEKQKRIRRLLFRRKTRPVQEAEAATLIQCTWRSHMARRYTHALILLTQDKKAIAAQRIQSILRRKLVEARHRILVKKRELQRLERQSMQRSQQLEEEDRRRLYELQDEFTEEAEKIINRKLLMRPNTKFAVLWKLMFVICIGVEISQKALGPLVKNRLSKHSKDDTYQMSIRELLAEQLIPKATSDRKECGDFSKTTWSQKLHLKKAEHSHISLDYTNSSWYCREPFSTWLDGGRDVISLALKPYPVHEWDECKVKSNLFQRFRGKEKLPKPWYCSEPCASIQTYYRSIVDFFVDEFMVVVSIVCFMDVFVTFFTGEIHADSGELVPKGFFARWISPGLLMQLMLNPAIGPVSTFVFSNMREMYFLGPVRVLRWCIAVFVPIAYMGYKMILRGLDQTDLDESVVDFYNSRIRRSSVAFA